MSNPEKISEVLPRVLDLLEQLRETRAKIESLRPTNRFLSAGDDDEKEAESCLTPSR